MDKQTEILLNSYQNINSVNIDSYNKIELKNKLSEITEYDIRGAVNATEVFDAERAANQIYRIYGRIEYLSLLNGLKSDYFYFSDFFLPQTEDCKTIINSFDFYLTKATTGYTSITNTSNYIRYFEVIATPNEFEIFPVGFANNVYGEQTYAFNFNVDFNISNYYDHFGFPATELFLYAQYKPSTAPLPEETLSGITWTNTGISGKTKFITTTLNIGDFVKTINNQKIGDIIEYSAQNFQQTQISSQQFYISTIYYTKRKNKLIWKYNPFTPIRLRYFTDSIYQVNTGSTTYDSVQSIPPYAIIYPENTNNFLWRDIQPEGYSDPLTGIGNDNPFLNKKRYSFSSIILNIVPDLSDSHTLAAFNDVWFDRNTIIADTKPIGDINNIGKPCQ